MIPSDPRPVVLSHAISDALRFNLEHRSLSTRDPYDPWQEFQLIARKELEAWIAEARALENKRWYRFGLWCETLLQSANAACLAFCENIEKSANTYPPSDSF
jgi:hypothetical protein